MASLQERIKNIEEYRPDINFKDGTFILRIKFKKGWTIIEPENQEEVAFAEDKQVNNLYWYVSTIENSDMIFDIIEETIAVNKEMEKKLALYKEKVKELQELFLSNESYDRLLTLQFVIPDEKKKSKRGSKKTETIILEDEVKNAEECDNAEAVGSTVTTTIETKPDAIITPTVVNNDIDEKIARAIGE